MWSVTVEAEGDLREPSVERGRVEQLMRELGTGKVSVGYMPHRFSACFCVEGSDPADATQRALTFWGDATSRVGLPGWPIVRVEAHLAT